MKIAKRLAANYLETGAVTIAFLGDSVTNGVFEVTMPDNEKMQYVFDFEAVYHNQLKKRLNETFPQMAVNIINAGLNGNNTPASLARLDRDVISHSPDLVVVCLGLNDIVGELDQYLTALRGIFEKLTEYGCEIIFMTPNMMNTRVSPKIIGEPLVRFAKKLSDIQNGGKMDLFISSAKELASTFENVHIADCYSMWKSLAASGADTTALLSNHLNHPSRGMHKLFAEELFRVMMFED